jgi:RNA polymerase sigma-70 factor (ECF subfamily)
MNAQDIVIRDDSGTTAGRESSSEDIELDEIAIRGVRDDFIRMYREHYPRIVRALELGGSERPAAEDIAQEAFARTLSHWRRVRRGTNPAGYVYRVAFRLAWRSSTRELQVEPEITVVDVAGEATLQVEIEATLRGMPDARRRCAVLCLVTGLSTKDTAALLHIAESTVRKQIERARSDFHLAIDDRG